MAGAGELSGLRPAPDVGDEAGQELERALGVCFRELDRRERTVTQVRARLERAGTSATTAEAAVAWLTERGFVDDAGYAERFATDRRRLDGWGRERIRGRLESAGVAAELIDAALDAGGTAEEAEAEELDAAVAVLAARMRGTAAAARERRRALGLLVRRGYSEELAAAAVARHFGRTVDVDE